MLIGFFFSGYNGQKIIFNLVGAIGCISLNNDS